MSRKKSLDFTRREFVQVGLGAAAVAPLAIAAGCGSSNSGSTTPPNTNAKVALVQCKTYDQATVDAAFQNAAQLIGGLATLVSGKVVCVKVNFTSGGSFVDQFGIPAGQSYITDGTTAISLAKLLFAAGATKVRFVDSVSIADTMENICGVNAAKGYAGWDVATLKSLGDVEFENTRNLGNGTSYVQRAVPGGGYLFNYFLLNHSYSDCDVFISMARMKRHTTCGITLSMKCLFGTTPNSKYGDQQNLGEDALGYRGPMHGYGVTGWAAGGFTPPGARSDKTPQAVAGDRIPYILADLNAALHVDLAIIDGISSMTIGEGPWMSNPEPQPQPINPGVILMGFNAVSTDAVGAQVMGYDPQAQRGTHPFDNPPYANPAQPCANHLQLANDFGIGSNDPTKIDVLGMTVADALCPFG